MTSRSGKEEYYCQIHKPKYDRIECIIGSIIKYIKEVEVTKEGKIK